MESFADWACSLIITVLQIRQGKKELPDLLYCCPIRIFTGSSHHLIVEERLLKKIGHYRQSVVKVLPSPILLDFTNLLAYVTMAACRLRWVFARDDGKVANAMIGVASRLSTERKMP
ncbi:hypothetical protein ACLOJK_034182 [Asimina triloba]